MAVNLQNVILKISAGEPRQLLGDPTPQVAFSGRSNVGKSSLINSMLGRKSLARVCSAPGKTVTVNFYEVDKRLYLVDLPGYGFACYNKDEEGFTTRYLVKRVHISLTKKSENVVKQVCYHCRKKRTACVKHKRKYHARK